MGDDAEEGETAARDEEPPRKRSRGDDLYVFKNSRLPEYKIGRSSDIAARSDALQKSPVEVAKGREWHACSLQTALAAIGHAIDSENAQQ